jgi:DNA-binding MarR family transcriptional regulator
MNPEARHELDLLEAVSENANITQRRLASKLGIALGLTNIYLKRLVRKGYVKYVNARPNRLVYLITPTGIAEQTRLTYEFMEYSLRLYRGARLRVSAMLAPVAQRDTIRVALYGTGEAAELAYVCLKEFGVEPVAVFDSGAAPVFFNIPVRSIAEHGDVQFDVIIVGTLDDPSDAIRLLQLHGIAPGKLVPLREPPLVQERG